VEAVTDIFHPENSITADASLGVEDHVVRITAFVHFDSVV
jgi:hypothetical protein